MSKQIKWTLVIESQWDEEGVTRVNAEAYNFPENWIVEQVRELLREKGFQLEDEEET